MMKSIYSLFAITIIYAFCTSCATTQGSSNSSTVSTAALTTASTLVTGGAGAGYYLFRKNRRGYGELNAKKVKNIKLLYDQNTKFISGEAVPIGVEAWLNTTGTKIANTKGYAEGDLDWDKYKVEVSGGTFINGKIHIHEDVTKIPNNTVEVKVSLVERPELQSSASFKLSSIASFVLKHNVENGEGLAPNIKFKIGIKASLEDGTTTLTKGFLGGQKGWESYDVTVKGGEFNKGTITIGYPKDNKVYVTAQLKNKPELKKEFELKLDYKIQCTANFAGRYGEHGQNGKRGRDGRKGANYSKTGGNGGHGTNGTDGEDGGRGGDGGDGQNVVAYVRADRDDALN
ncbi:MAG: hypothetical protein MK212_17355, partial [Saprospiraceae bacterium]|nr:hypothetical protein [Saprospiraceae bacterium]